MARSSIKPWHLAAAVVLIVLVVGLQPGGFLSGLSTTQSGNQPGKVVVTKTITFACVDSIAGANCGAVTIALYQGTTNTLLETLTASSAGVIASTNTYTSGTALTLKVSGNSKVTEYIPFTAPTGYVTDTTENVGIYAITLGAWTQSFTGTGGTTFSSSTTALHGLNGFSGNQVTINANIAETTASAGYKASYDIINLLNQYWLVQIDDGGGANSNTQFATVNGLTHLTVLGNTHYNFVVCPDGLAGNGGNTRYTIQLNSQTQGSFDGICSGSLSGFTSGNTVAGYNAAYTFTVAVGGLTTSAETFQFKMYYYADWGYFVTNGNLGPSATQSGSTFTIKFTG